MKKSLSLLLAIALVISMFGSMAYAADNELTAQQKFDALKEKGIFAGYEDGTAGLDKNMTRAQFARIAALLKELDVDTVPATSSFTDVPLTHWAVEEVNAADKAGIMNGKGNGKFDPSGDVTIEQLARVLVDALGLEVDEDAVVDGASAWAGGYVAAAIKAGLISADADFKAAANRELLVTASFTANAAIEAAKAAAAIPATLDVKEIVANNLKTVKVVFNQPVDKDTVNNENVKITDEGANVTLSDDGITAYVVLDKNDGVAQSTELEVKVNGVKTKDGKELKDFSKKVVALDSTVPVATGAAFVNHKEIVIQFSEPMKFSKPYYEGLSNIKLDGATVIATATPDFVKNTVTLKFPSLLKDGTLKLEVSDIRDFAGYNIAKAEFDILVTEDKEAPVLVSAEMKNLTRIEAVFNERVDVTGSFKVNGEDVDAATPDATGTKITLDLKVANALDLGAIVEIKIAYKGQKDVAGNEVKDEKTYSFKVNDDTTLPSVSVKVDSGNKLVLTFSKSMLVTEGTISVLNDKKETQKTLNVNALGFKGDSNNTVLELSAGDLGLQGIDSGKYFLNIKNMKDSTVRKNLLPEQTVEFAALDTKAPVLNEEYLTKNADEAKDQTITFYFNEAVDADTAKNLSNYRIKAGGPLVGSPAAAYVGPISALSDVSFSSISGDGKSVTLKFKDVHTLQPTFEVYAIKDRSGNMMTLTEVDVYGGVALVIDNVKVEAKNKVVVEFTSQVASVDPSAFVIVDTTDSNKVTQFVSASIDGAKVTFITSKDLRANPEGYKLKVTNKGALKDVFEKQLVADNGDTLAAVVLADHIKPSVAEAKRHADDHDQFVIKFDEPFSAFDASKVIVRNKDNAILEAGAGKDYTIVENLATGEIVITVIQADYNDIINVQFEIGAVTDTKSTGTKNTNGYISLTSADKIVAQ